MKALVKSKPEPGLWLEEVPVPEIGINDVLIRVTASRQVELICLVGQLRDALQIDGFKFGDLRLHLQRIKILAVVRELCFRRSPCRVRFIQHRARQIFLGH